jgi:hypothetical protein
MTLSDLFVANASRVRGAQRERGAVVLRPDYFVFAPRAHTGAFVGYAKRVLPPAFVDAAAYVRYLASLEEGDFDTTVDGAVRQCGWLRVERSAARIVKKHGWFRRHKVTLSFETEGESVHLEAPVDVGRLPDVERMLLAWTA